MADGAAVDNYLARLWFCGNIVPRSNHGRVCGTVMMTGERGCVVVLMLDSMTTLLVNVYYTTRRYIRKRLKMYRYLRSCIPSISVYTTHVPGTQRDQWHQHDNDRIEHVWWWVTLITLPFGWFFRVRRFVPDCLLLFPLTVSRPVLPNVFCRLVLTQHFSHYSRRTSEYTTLSISSVSCYYCRSDRPRFYYSHSSS